ncbi:MAG: pyridoxal phosphate-dependent aminotransferase [Candidatus Marinamargulisbacteria bacterium]
MTTFQSNELATTCDEVNLRPISHSETLLINEAQDNLKKTSTTPVYKFGFGQSPFSPPESAIDSLRKYASEHDYLPVAGLPACRDAVAVAHQSYRPNITSDDVVIAPGSKMIIYAIMACYQQATVILPQPSWVSYAPQASLLNHAIQQVPTNFDTQWKISPKTLDAVCQSITDPSQKILVLNYPGNPTGMTYTSHELQAIAEVARQHHVLIISDEIYGWLNHTNTHESIAAYYPEGTFITTGLSKWCGAGGWRFGAGIFPQNASKKLKITYNGIASETYSTTAAPVQYTAVDIYKNISNLTPFIHQQQTLLKDISQRIVRQLSDANVRVHQPDGGFYIFPDFSEFKETFIKRGLTTCEAFCVDLLKTTGVAMLPGSAFGFETTDFYTRMCYVDFNGTTALKSLEKDAKITDQFIQTHCPNIINGITALCDYLKAL